MKWLNTFKKWFQTEEEIIEIEEIIIDEPLEPKELVDLDFSKHKSAQNWRLEQEKEKKKKEQHLLQAHNTSRDPDTKILFQYPKGQFKFPVIPDHAEKESRPRRVRTKEPVKPGKTERRATGKKSHTEKPAAKINTKKEEVTNKIMPSKKPFRPTEIPSAVYGFQRPSKIVSHTEEIIEYELKTVKSAIPLTESLPLDIPAVYRKEDSLIDLESSTDPNEQEKKELIERLELSESAGAEVAAGILEPAYYQETGNKPEPIEVVLKEEAVEEMEPESFGIEERVIQTEESAEIETPQVEEDLTKTVKKHIPFNVMMLKKDKEKITSFVPKAQKKSLLTEETVKPQEKVETNQTTYIVSEEEVASGVEEVSSIDAINTTSTDIDVEAEHEVTETAGIAENVQEEITAIPTMVSLNDVNQSDQQPESSTIIQTEVQLETENPYYVFPSGDLLTPAAPPENDQIWVEEQKAILDGTLKNFNVRARVVNVTQGPAVTRFEVQPEPGVKVNKVTNLMDDIKLSLAAEDLRMEAPIPGKHTIGIEIPNRKSKPVFLREVLESDPFTSNDSPLTVALGLDISGQPVVTDLKKMPHGLIAGATGSGKSVCINSMLVSLLYKATPQELKLLLIDPKMVELAPYNRIPHLVSPVITDVKAATAALKWAVDEMERRYELFVHAGARDIGRYNQNAEAAGQYANKLPYILIIIDELADLMMVSPADVEEAICRIAQKARACGIHLIVATQRPSVDVITGLIKANIPTRIAFSVSSQVDSRTIIDSGGAEKLLGKGDMLFAENGSSKTVRLQGTFVNDDEIDAVVQHVRNEQQPNYLFEQEDLLNKVQATEDSDDLFFEACEFAIAQSAASASSLQRRFHVGYNRAARLIEMMERQGIVSESRGSKPRDVLITEEELEFLQDKSLVK
ncbi:DNA translocase FtsK [Peribacillus sp. FSL H8-0477]|uniref:DNA translocase FtsK n=1 Tax=Peribacillus sp. FSL H8-0477 TaxID=2921388 RepID=UPI0030F9A768